MGLQIIGGDTTQSLHSLLQYIGVTSLLHHCYIAVSPSSTSSGLGVGVAVVVTTVVGASIVVVTTAVDGTLKFKNRN